MNVPVAETYVVSGNLISATSSVTDHTVVEDVVNSNLLCQLAADKKLTSRFIDPAEWLDFYRNSLGKVFWQITNSNTVSYPVPALVHSLTVMKVLEATFFKTLDRALINSIEESIGLWIDLPEASAPSLLFNAKTHVELDPVQKDHPIPQPVSVVNLQISIIHGGSRLSVCSVYFKTSELVASDVFNQKFAVKALSGNVSVSSFKAELIESNYAGIRQQIIDKLGDKNIRENIMLIPANLVPSEVQTNTSSRQVVDSMDI
jgi:hypothetical protein